MSPVAAGAAPVGAAQAQSDTTTDGQATGVLDTAKGGGVEIVVGAGGMLPGRPPGGAGGGGGGGGRPCAVVAAQPATSGPDTLPAYPRTLSGAELARLGRPRLVEGSFYLRYCRVTAQVWELVGIFQFRQRTPAPAAPGVAPEALARLALARLGVPRPRPHTAPPRELDTVVGITTWLWIDPAPWHPLRTTAALPGLAVTATVTPATVTWDMGEGRHTHPTVCPGPGTAYHPHIPDRYQHTTCGYIYRWASYDHTDDTTRPPDDDTYHATATITWTVTWTASNHDNGTLGDLHTTTAFDLNVDEIQATICGTTPLTHCHP